AAVGPPPVTGAPPARLYSTAPAGIVRPVSFAQRASASASEAFGRRLNGPRACTIVRVGTLTSTVSRRAGLSPSPSSQRTETSADRPDAARAAYEATQCRIARPPAYSTPASSSSTVVQRPIVSP